MFALEVLARPARIAVLAAVVAAGFGGSLVSHASAAPSLPGCPSTAEIIGGFSKGLGYLVEDGSINKSEAKDARAQFTSWASEEKGLGCAMRDGMMKSGGELLDFLGLTPAQMKSAYEAGDSLAEMAAANGH
ncbi:MAG: hypothetical protein ACR2J8_03300, partial [Thermomicrobiales bacterium]